MKKITLEFDKHAFDMATDVYNEKMAIIDNIETIAKNHLDINIKVDKSTDLKDTIYKAIEDKHKAQNLLNLTGEKLVELLQININPILEGAKHLESFDNIEKGTPPAVESFTISVENEHELKRYNFAVKVIDTIKEAKALTNDSRDNSVYMRAFAGILKFNLEKMELEPSPTFVKNI